MRSVERLCCATILIALSAVVIGTLSCFAANALVSWQGDDLQIAFGSVVATELTELVGALPAMLSDRTADVRVTSVGDQADRVTGTYVLQKDRVRLFWKGKCLTPNQSVSYSSGQRDSSGLSPLDEFLIDPNRLVVSVAIKPCDPPGVYECPVQLSVRELDPESPDSYGEDESITVLISVRVQPWVRMSAAKSSVILLPEIEPLAGRLVLSSSPTVVRVASNTQWTLCCQLENMPSPESIQASVLIETGSPSGPCTALLSSSRLTPAMEIPLAAGGLTCVDGKYWCEVPFTLTINNPTTIRSGPLDFEVCLSVRTEPSP